MPLRSAPSPPIAILAPTLIIPCSRSMAAEKWLFPLFSVSFVSLLLFLSAISGFTASSAFFDTQPSPFYVRRGAAHPPAFAYFISGGRGDARRMLRLLLAVYHPRNSYLLHLSADAPAWERADLATSVRLSIPAIRAFGNVHVVGKPDAMTYMGSSVLAATLHAAAVLLRMDSVWDWFVTLSSSDYPLVTQDDLIHVFSSVPRDLNFIDHTSDLGWKEYQRVQPIIVDAGIYLSRRNSFFEASEKRPTPDAFKFFTGSPWLILSRRFIEYCILGWDNLPRTLLLYFTNVMLPQEGYFHSVICNSPDYQNTTVNNDLRYMLWDNPPQMEPHLLNKTDYDKMVKSGLPFARKFSMDDPVLDEIDDKILKRWHHRSVPGAWCTGRNRWWIDPCSQWSNVNIVKPGSQAKRFGQLMKRYLDEWKSGLSSCK
ncbi:beta-glucuronosyltransferase GlcAT14A [Elaeis guineensis]|uniref:Beta-glucuronosyltransferase GlcAT14A n=1 Tax=Elaeis guineensis var. tenera TaxID=51953 RepID=A0A6I9QWF4_ELAGV|nr:beta-glucuronosyltransferase GlcAT14A [Elaeis guineensis]